jgi:peptidoglycan/LPS O-acetylase OafA/YrhL
MIELAQLFLHFGEAFTGKQGLDALFLNVVMMQAVLNDSTWNEPAWAISAEWVCYFLIPFMIFLLDKTSRKTDTVILFILVFVLLWLNLGSGTLNFVSVKSIQRCGFEMILGVVAYKYRWTNDLNKSSRDDVLFVIFFSLFLMTLFCSINNVLTVCLFPFLIISTSNLPTNNSLSHPILVYIGKLSYSVYMVQWLLLTVLDEVTRLITGKPLHLILSLPGMIGTTVLILLGVMFVAWLALVLVEEPFRYKIRSVFKVS